MRTKRDMRDTIDTIHETIKILQEALMSDHLTPYIESKIHKAIFILKDELVRDFER